MSTVLFRPLKIELEATLGWTDGFSLNVLEHPTNDGMVFHHERIHGSIINTTIDGNLLRLLWIAGPRLSDRQHSKNLERASHYIFEGSRFAYECAATFIGVMNLVTAQERAAALGSLPDEYLQYYKFMSGIVEDQCKSSFLSYLLAQSIAHFWFSSRALIEFSNADYNGHAVMNDEFCPDWRARASAPWLKQSGVQGAIDASLKAYLANDQLCEITRLYDSQELLKGLVRRLLVASTSWEGCWICRGID